MLVTAAAQFDAIGGGHLELRACGPARLRATCRACGLERLALGPSLGQCCGIAPDTLARMVCPIGLPGAKGKKPAVIASQLLLVCKAQAAVLDANSHLRNFRKHWSIS
ncbi:MAG: hypothetical protein ACOH2K_16030 [Burkholderiaceae bacterium]